MHISNVHVHGVHKPDTSLQRDATPLPGNECTADSKLDIDEPIEIVINWAKIWSVKKRTIK